MQSGRYLHLGIVVHYKTVCNNNVLSVQFLFKLNRCLFEKIKPPLPLPDKYFLIYWTLFFDFLIISLFLLKLNAFPMWYVMRKWRRTSSAKGSFELGFIASKSSCNAIYHLCHCSCCLPGVFCCLVQPKHMLVGRVNVNSILMYNTAEPLMSHGLF